MIAGVFEVWPAEGRTQDYLDLAASLRDDLAAIDGFVSVERFRSLADPVKLLSLSFWRDEAAVRAWRERPGHRASQAKGRAGVLRDYRLRIAAVMRVSGARNLVLPHFACCFDYAAWRTRARSSWKPARPYMVRLSIFSRLICPSTGLVVHGRSSAAWMAT